jgi:hypothetical protein
MQSSFALQVHLHVPNDTEINIKKLTNISYNFLLLIPFLFNFFCHYKHYQAQSFLKKSKYMY